MSLTERNDSFGRGELPRQEDLNLKNPLNNTEDLLKLHDDLCKKARTIMSYKNSDYGGAGEPFRNFHGFGAFGILVRLSDKIARMRTFLEKLKEGKGMAVITESFEDTAIDAINYVILFVGYVRRWGAEK